LSRHKRVDVCPYREFSSVAGHLVHFGHHAWLLDCRVSK
jgi:hypothetical protein